MIKNPFVYQLAFILIFCCFSFSWCHPRFNNITITGKVTSSDASEAMPGVHVLVKGTAFGTVTDADGNYSINAPDGSNILVFSFIGYVTKEVPINKQSIIDVVMELDVRFLGEIIVVGYGEHKKSDITGSIASVSGKAIEDMPVSSVDEALSGRAPGVYVAKQSGMPGTGIQIKIRGTNSISSKSAPLYVVDGIPMISEATSQMKTSETDVNFINTSDNSLSFLNTDDIASIEILKDASATAIYGSRGSNGVIMITTKQGEVGKPKLTFDYYTGIQTGPTRLIKMTNSKEFLTLMNEAAANDGLGEGVYTTQMGLNINDPNLQNTNWFDEIFEPASINQYQVSFQGGSANDTGMNTRYYTSFSYLDQGGVQIGTGFKRYSGKINLDFDVSKKLSFSNKTTVAHSTLRTTDADATYFGVFVNAQAADPTMPVRENDGSWADPYFYGSWWTLDNPVKLAALSNKQTQTNRFINSFSAKYAVAPNLTFISTTAIDATFQRDYQYISSETLEAKKALALGKGQNATFQDLTLLNDNTLTFDKYFNKTHHLIALLGNSQQVSRREYANIEGRNFPMDGPGKLESAGTITAGSAGEKSWGLQSYFGRINYGFREKYLLTLTTRIDGSSRFGLNNRYGVFPSGSLAWNLKQENFLSSSNTISDLKLRAGYGVTGSQEGIAYFASRALWSPAAYNGNGGLYTSQQGNPDLTWEKNKQSNIGLDLELFEGRIGFTADFFVSNTEDLLLDVPIPSTGGFSSMTQNAGKIRNKGLELSFNSVNVTAPFTWKSDFNISFIRNTVVDVINNGEIQGSQAHILQEGEPIGTFFLIHFLGVDPQTGDAMFEDLNNDGIINTDDAKMVGNAQPKFFGGFFNSFAYKNLTLDVFLQYTYGNMIFDRSRLQTEQYGFNLLGTTDWLLANGNFNKRVWEERWQKPGDVTDVPRMSTQTQNFQYYSDQFLDDGSYLRLRNVRLSYAVDENLIDKLKVVRSLKLYAQAQNILTWTKYLGSDPEVETSGNPTTIGQDYAGLPQMKSFTVGVNVGF